MMLSRFFKDLWGGLRSLNPAAFVILLLLAAILAVVICALVLDGPECTKYTISYGDYRFDVNNYSRTENSITFQRGSSNITVVGDFTIYENNCSQ